MDYADMLEVVRTFQLHSPPANIEKVITEHTVDASGHCPLCRTVGCTIRAAAVHAQRANRSI